MKQLSGKTFSAYLLRMRALNLKLKAATGSDKDLIATDNANDWPALILCENSSTYTQKKLEEIR